MTVTLLIDIALAGLLAATLFHAMRLERALGVLKRDRAALESLVSGFNASTRQAETGAERLRAAAEGAGRHVAKQIEAAQSARDDLAFLTERGERLADRLEQVVRAARPLVADAPRRADLRLGAADPQRSLVAPSMDDDEPEARPRSKAEMDLLRALRMAR